MYVWERWKENKSKIGEDIIATEMREEAKSTLIAKYMDSKLQDVNTEEKI